ncbi:hypothetical protein [Elioraea sp.]|uniref:phage tail terminator protein n=1 Tax=Elioraea sp. TaxID=2185103 RepID=UPI0025C503C3|nr:hypothetical protein [Elioraea sp.]
MIDSIVTRIKATLGNPFRTVEGAAEYSALQAPPPAARCPAAYVIELADDAGQNSLATSAVRQRITETFAVVMIVASLRDHRGEAAQALLQPVRAFCVQALIGWAPDANHDAITYLRGRLVDASEGYVVWQAEFQVRSTLRSV